jgi:hypothetical protein
LLATSAAVAQPAAKPEAGDCSPDAEMSYACGAEKLKEGAFAAQRRTIGGISKV